MMARAVIDRCERDVWVGLLSPKPLPLRRRKPTPKDTPHGSIQQHGDEKEAPKIFVDHHHTPTTKHRIHYTDKYFSENGCVHMLHYSLLLKIAFNNARRQNGLQRKGPISDEYAGLKI